jgi:hypothetical protein
MSKCKCLTEFVIVSITEKSSSNTSNLTSMLSEYYEKCNHERSFCLASTTMSTITCEFLHRIQIWLTGGISGTTVASVTGIHDGSNSTLLNSPSVIIVDNNGYVRLAWSQFLFYE